MRILFIGDFHGIIPKIGKQEKIDYVVSLGDYSSILNIQKKLIKIILNGREPKLKDFQNNELSEIKDKLLEDFSNVLEYLSSIAKTYFILGNADLICFFDEMMEIARKFDCTYINKRIVKIDNFSLIGLDGMPKRGDNFGWINDIPEIVNNFNDLTEYYSLEKLFKRLKNPNIFVSHAPPYGILDNPSPNNINLFSKLYKESNIKNVGSYSVRKIVDNFSLDYHISAHTHLGGKISLKKGNKITKLINIGAAKDGNYKILEV